MPLTPIGYGQLSKIGIGVQRPEDMVVSRDGRVWMSDQASAAAEALPNSGVNLVGNAGGSPNGIRDLDSRNIIANVGGFDGGGTSGPVQQLDVETGEIEVLADQIDCMPLLAPTIRTLIRRDASGWHIRHRAPASPPSRASRMVSSSASRSMDR